ncbi:MAG TPA: phosphoglucosamine mutase [Gemmatimonadales bacterium]|nr:phosphoglucosamine mutase [Gemmatimonadales bacterium]
MTDTLMVGVSGVRGIVDKDLTPAVVTRWARGFGHWARRVTPRVVLGRDSRRSGPTFMRAAREGLLAAGCDVIEVGMVPTPTIQLAVAYHRAGGGIAITASHNPIEWNALKFIGPDAIFLDGQAGAAVQQLALADEVPPGRAAAPRTVTTDQDAVARHLAAVVALPVVDAGRIRDRKFTVALDTVRGAGGPVMTDLLERLGCRIVGINLDPDGAFPRSPEPVPEHLGELGDLVRRSGADLGLAVDPDVDRLALVDEAGTPIGEDYTLAFAVRAVFGASRLPRFLAWLRGPVVCNLSTSLVVHDAARAVGARVVRTPVGEVHVARTMVALRARIGGEGNGGVMYAPLHAGRDAPVAAALVLGLLARVGQRVGALVAAAPRYAIVKAKVPRGLAGPGGGPALASVYAALRHRFPDARVDTQDGLHLAWRDRWLHVRPSNTEPIIRLIAEAPTGADAQHLVDEGRRLCAAS